MALTAKDELRAQIDKHKARIEAAKARDAARSERYNSALEAAMESVRQRRSELLPCSRYGRLPDPPTGLVTWTAEPVAEVDYSMAGGWLANSEETADASLETVLRQIEEARAKTEADLQQAAACAKCRFFFRCLALTWLYGR